MVFKRPQKRHAKSWLGTLGYWNAIANTMLFSLHRKEHLELLLSTFDSSCRHSCDNCPYFTIGLFNIWASKELQNVLKAIMMLKNFFSTPRLIETWNIFDPPGQPTVTADRDHCFRPCRPSVLTCQNPAKQNSENNVRYWRDCGSGRVDHWWHLSCFFFYFFHPYSSESAFVFEFFLQFLLCGLFFPPT